LDDESQEARNAASCVIEATKAVLGRETDIEFECDEEIGDLLVKIAGRYKGCMFIFDSVVSQDGEALVGLLKEAAT
jgi:hypothetical protein